MFGIIISRNDARESPAASACHAGVGGRARAPRGRYATRNMHHARASSAREARAHLHSSREKAGAPARVGPAAIRTASSAAVRACSSTSARSSASTLASSSRGRSRGRRCARGCGADRCAGRGQACVLVRHRARVAPPKGNRLTCGAGRPWASASPAGRSPAPRMGREEWACRLNSCSTVLKAASPSTSTPLRQDVVLSCHSMR